MLPDKWRKSLKGNTGWRPLAGWILFSFVLHFFAFGLLPVSRRENSAGDKLLLYPVLRASPKGNPPARSSLSASVPAPVLQQSRFPPPQPARAEAIDRQTHPEKTAEQTVETSMPQPSLSPPASPLTTAAGTSVTAAGNDALTPNSSSLPPVLPGNPGEAKNDIPTAIPMYESNPLPTYPEIARRRNWEGEVLLRVRVGAGGTVLQTAVERSSGHPILDRAACDGVERWRFQPARRGEVVVESTVLIPIPFVLKKK